LHLRSKATFTAIQFIFGVL